MDDIIPLTLWEAHKPLLRWVCISKASFLKKERQALHRQLESIFDPTLHSKMTPHPNIDKP